MKMPIMKKVKTDKLNVTPEFKLGMDYAFEKVNEAQEILRQGGTLDPTKVFRDMKRITENFKEAIEMEHALAESREMTNTK